MEIASLKSYIDVTANLSKKAKNDLEKDFLKLMNNAVFGKPMEILENIKKLNLPQQKEEETIWCQNQMTIRQSFSQKIHQQQK